MGNVKSFKSYKPQPFTTDPLDNKKIDNFITETMPPIYKQKCVDVHDSKNKYHCEQIRMIFFRNNCYGKK